MKTENPMQKAFYRLAQTFALALVLLASAGAAYAQDVTVSMADVAQRVGTSASVAVNLTGVSANVNSFDFTVTADPGITFTGVTRTGSLTAGSEWDAIQTNVATGAVSAFAAGSPINTNGTLIYLNFDLGAADATGTVTLTGFGLNAGTPSATAAPAFGFVAATRIMSASDHSVKLNAAFTASVSADDALVAGDNVNTIDFTFTYDPASVDVDTAVGSNGVSVGTLAAGWSVQANDNGTGTITVTSFGPQLTGTGEIFQVALTSIATGTSLLTLGSVTFSPGSPSYGLRAGTVVSVVNAAPVADAASLTTDEDTDGSVTVTGTDSNGDALTFAIASQPTNGSVTMSGADATYTPNSDYNGSDSFTFTASDGSLTSGAATVTVTVTAVNDAPVAADVSGATTEDTAVDVTLAATDVDGDALTYSAGAAANGTVTVAGATATYTPNANFNGSDSFTYTANDGTVDSASATVTVTVTAVNDAPVAADAALAVDEDTSGDVTLSATDSEGDAVTFSVGTAANGTVALSGAVATYTPNADFNGSDSFTYTANDGTSDSAPATVTVTVAAVNDAPVFTAELADSMQPEDGGTITFTYVATDVDGDALAYTMTSGPASATVDGSTGEFSFDPSGNAGSYTVTVSVSDGTVSVASASAAVVIYHVDAIFSPLSGVHEVGPVVSAGSGWTSVRLIAATNLLEVTGSYSGLVSDYSGSHIHVGSVGGNGGVVVTLSATAGSDTRSGTWNLADNTYDLSALSYPSGMDAASFVVALHDGGAYVNVHSAAHGGGELRGQLLSPTNGAPDAAIVRGPASVTVTGDPGSSLFSLSWLPASDPDGDTVHYLFEIATDANFSNHLMFASMGPTNGIAFTVAEAAALYDSATGGSPGNISVGGSATLHARVTSTDGSRWTVGDTAEIILIRGIVTDSETNPELPAEFALRGNYPNPFNPSTTIRFDLPQTADISLTVVDLLGRQVLLIPSETFDAGTGRTIQIDASSLASGIYMYRLIATMQEGVQIKVGSMSLIK